MSDNLEYTLAIEKGCKILRLLEANDTNCQPPVGIQHASAESIFTKVGDLEVHDYTGSRSDSCAENSAQVIKRLSGALKALGVDGDMACDGGKNFRVEHKHEQTCTVGGVEYPLCNHKDGVLIAHTNHSAPHVAALQNPDILKFPPLCHWSDIAYLQWLTISTFDSNQAPSVILSPAPIEYIFRLSIHNNVRTYSILNHILTKHGHSTYHPWPGVTFDMDSEEGKAILGTPNGAGTAWLLIQRGRELRHRKIEKVTVFYAENEDDMYRWPSLLFWVV